MGSKNSPGSFDCYAAAHPDEPMFVILGRDPIGAGLVRLWAAARPALEKAGDDAKIAEAVACADDMQAYCTNYGRQPYDALACLPFTALADELRRRGATVTPVPHGGDSEATAPLGVGNARGVYVASRVRHAHMWASCRASGVPIISTWIDEAGDGDTDDFSELWARIQREITSADRLVFFAEKGDDPWKGAFIEIGIACAAGIPVFVVLDPEIELDGRTCRPLGSWLHHPNVLMAPTLHDAFTASEYCHRFTAVHVEGNQP